ncbi:hypothetical protein [Flavobacterium aquicola]|uniref:Uncharacterized protein n=1 Tax=Flavobacterium aquicola TaxID=1682742 RepID=A0A3E0ERX5_9FLAO|nr:hypothetical protein [Flavobacterium aquicola]REH00983.1 hypothetical protein C8P67_102236 [Flavobacterium aquicola]
MDSFNLYIEAKDQYEKLVPEKNDGLIILSLYGKYKENDFTEENIVSIINKVFKDQGNESVRTEHNRNNNVILRLQESFLWRNETKRTYQFKKYGLEFCQSLEKRLIAKYNPAKIKRFFIELFNSLTTAVESGTDFNLWVEDHFDIRMPSLSSQIEILDQQVNESVSDFKLIVKSHSSEIQVILKEIEMGLDIIKEQASELRNAFQISYDIDEILTAVLEKNTAGVYVENIKKVQDFHDSSRNQLEQVSKRIEKIKPRIREFIYDFNKKDFDRKTNKFLTHILEHSSVKKRMGNKYIQFPDGIPDFKLRDSEYVTRLTLIPIREISPKAPITISKREINVSKRKDLVDKTAKWKYEKERVKYWTELAFFQLEQNSILEFTPFFFKILDTEKLSIAVKTAHNTLRRSAGLKNKYSITINKEVSYTGQNKGISIWQMTIQKK